MKKTTIILLALGLTSCGMFKVREKNVEAVGRIKKIAIVAMSMSQPAPRKLGVDLSKGSLEGMSGGSMIAENSPRAEQIYHELEKQLGTKFGWKVIALSDLKSNPGYQFAFASTMKGWQNKMPGPEGNHNYTVEGVMDVDSIRILGQKGRDELMQALKVDAILSIGVNVRIVANTVMGIGSHFPQAIAAFQIFVPNQEKAAWYDFEISGAQSTTSVGKTAFFDQDLMNTLSMDSAKDAISKIDPSLN